MNATDMINFIPPIDERDTDELIHLAHSNAEFCQQEAIDQAREELIKRNISQEYQQKILTDWENEIKDYEARRQIELKNIEPVKYSITNQVIIFLASPLILLGKVDYDMSISELKEENFKEKVKQRKAALIGGMIFYAWIFYLLSTN